MPTQELPAQDPISFAERILAILEEGSFATTYKFALLLAILDACQENIGADGSLPETIPTWRLAEHVAELYWSQTEPYHPPAPLEPVDIRQSHRGKRPKILTRIEKLRSKHDLVTPWDARTKRRDDWERLIRDVEWELIIHPIPRLQRASAGKEDRVLYDHDFTPPEREGRDRHQPLTKEEWRDRGEPRSIRLKPGVGEQLVRLGGLLRPVIQRHWLLEVQRMNQELGESLLEEFLFGSDRKPTAALRDGLAEIARKKCFYCTRPLRRNWEVDHFIPWARHPDNGVHNLVAACRTCNNSKRSLLAAQEHLERWTERTHDGGVLDDLNDLANQEGWEANAARTVAIARSQYLWLPPSARLWKQALSGSGGPELVEPPSPEVIIPLLQGKPPTDLPHVAEGGVPRLDDAYDP